MKRSVCLPRGRACTQWHCCTGRELGPLFLNRIFFVRLLNTLLQVKKTQNYLHVPGVTSGYASCITRPPSSTQWQLFNHGPVLRMKALLLICPFSPGKQFEKVNICYIGVTWDILNPFCTEHINWVILSWERTYLGMTNLLYFLHILLYILL